MPAWTIEAGKQGDVAISSRVRLARNIDGLAFPDRLEQPEAIELIEKTRQVLDSRDGYKLLRMDQLTGLQMQMLLEQHLISPDLIKRAALPSALILDASERLAVMINEEDHLRIQCILPGVDIEAAAECALDASERLCKALAPAFDPQFGYLTACPTNAGTGMRASVMVHLPALSMTGYMNVLLSAVGKLGVAVRGIYGEGSEAMGNLYQISNQLTLGRSEEEILRSLSDVCAQVIQRERMTRRTLLKNNEMELRDRLMRSVGVLRYAHKMDSKEFMRLLSDALFAQAIGFIELKDPCALKKLLVAAQPAMLQNRAGGTLEPQLRDQKRAQLVRAQLMDISVL